MKRVVDPVRFVTGTVGEPGAREFFIQVVTDLTDGGNTHCVGVEKEQASRLAVRLQEFVARYETVTGADGEAPHDQNPLQTPIEPDFLVGDMSITFDSEAKRFAVEFFPLGIDPEDYSDDNPPPVGLSVTVDAPSAREFVRRTLSVVSAGRPPCPLCHGPLGPSGHICPRANGYRR